MKSDNNEDNKIIFGLSLIPNFSFRRIKKLFDVFKNWEKIWNLDYNELINYEFNKELAQKFINSKNKIDYENIWNKYQEKNVKIINYFEDGYPNLLKQIFYPPLVIFAKGNIELLKRKNFLSVVGSRKSTQYGKSIIEKFVGTCANKNITIVSGLANGIDSLSHIEALNTSGSTIAVLGSDIEQPTPFSNLNLAKNIEKSGLLISEYPIGYKYRKQSFPQRNRIIAGLSQATFIVEAGLKSGALITANFAISENRDILVSPGSIFSENHAGCNHLLKQGAKIVLSIDDILEIYNIENRLSNEKTIDFVSFEQEIIYKTLIDGPLAIDKIIESSRLNTNVVIYNITEMELSGLIKNLGGQIYQLSK